MGVPVVVPVEVRLVAAQQGDGTELSRPQYTQSELELRWSSCIGTGVIRGSSEMDAHGVTKRRTKERVATKNDTEKTQ